MDSRTIFLGVDGGGTGCRVRLRAADGRILGEAEAGRANLYASLSETAANVTRAARAALHQAGLGEDMLARMQCGLGLAGGQMRAAAEELVRLLPFASALVVTDAHAALAGAFSRGDGAIAIFGTGSAYLAQRNGVLRAVGGHGFHVGDAGSGADLGRQVLSQSLNAHDGVIAPSVLTGDILQMFRGDPLRLIAFARSATPADYASLAPRVFDHAQSGDAVAMGILAAGMTTIEASLRIVLEGVDKLCLLGGLAARYRPLLAESFAPVLCEPMADAMDGAILLVKEQRA